MPSMCTDKNVGCVITAKHFDRDPETNQVLWFAAAPVDMARPRVPKHSLEYLNFIAKKRKREIEGKNGSGNNDMDVDGADGSSLPAKAQRIQPTMSEMMKNLSRDMLASSS